MILLLDNYDSFTFNLYQMLGSIDNDIKVIRNDGTDIEEIIRMKPEGIVISPGPGRPEDAGICCDLIKELRGKIPILGVCLGEQAICLAYGAVITYAKALMHGKQSRTKIDTTAKIFHGLPEMIQVARYHSLAVDSSTLPEDLKVIAIADDGEVMAVADETMDVYGVQFHPESIMTPEGDQILKNFITLTKEKRYGS